MRGAMIRREPVTSRVARDDRGHDLRWQVAAVLFLIGTGMVFGLWAGPAILHTRVWTTPGDIWVTMRAAHVIAWGGEGILYQHSYGFITFPGVAVALAPVAMLSSALHLTESFPFTLPHPTAWFVLGPAEMALGSFLLFPLGALARRLGIPRGRRRLLLFLEVATIWPATVLWGHPEDLVALGFALYALMSALDERWRRCAVLAGVAIAFQPLAIVLVPLMAAYIPWRRWLSAASIAVAPSALLLMTPLLHTFKTTVHNLVDQPTSPTVMHPTPWVALAPVLEPGHMGTIGRWRMTQFGLTFVNHLQHFSASVAGGPSRLLAIVGAIAIACYVARRRPPEPLVFWCAGLALSLRCVFESVTVEYYAVPTLAVALLLAAHGGKLRLGFAVVSAAACTYVSYFHFSPWVYYVPVTATLLGTLLVGWPGRVGAEAALRAEADDVSEGSDVLAAGDAVKRRIVAPA
jgi:hypothetical protein